MWLVVLSCVALAGTTVAYSRYDLRSSDMGVYVDDRDVLMQDLYSRLANINPAYFLEREDQLMSAPDSELYEASSTDWLDDESEVKSRPRSPVAGGQTDTRDSEYIGHSSNAATDGFIYMSGGAGEGKQHLTPSGSMKNVHQVKSDEALPFYCHPPNPCPKGYTGEDGCQELIEDTADMQKAWIEKMMEKGLCTCDEEHMFDCPATAERDVSSKQTDAEQQAFDDVLERILGEQHESVDNPYVGGQKRQTLVAKKSPRVKRSQPDDRIERELDKLTVDKRNNNPYLKGTRLRTVAKKGSPGK